MPKNSIFCLSASRSQVERMIAALKAADFSSGDISVLLPDHLSTHDPVPAPDTPGAEGILSAVGKDGVIGGPLGWIAGIGPLVLPGVSPLVGGGPIVGAMESTATGGIAGGLIDLGLSDSEARRYHGEIMGGKILLSVQTKGPKQIACAREIFTRDGAEDICTSDEISGSATLPAHSDPSPSGGVPSSVRYSTVS
ncbi:MAG: DUF3341 domain-containing protein [Undibacterium sp.]|nr:DUF3341 domain-containing protein [Opitutaceae bacterium]